MPSMRHCVKMELLDSRCSKCKGTNWQCSKCQDKDKLTRRQAKVAAAAAKLAVPREGDPILAENLGPPTGVSIVHLIPDDIAKLTTDELGAIFCSSPIVPIPDVRLVIPVATPSAVNPMLPQTNAAGTLDVVSPTAPVAISSAANPKPPPTNAAGTSVSVNAESAPKKKLRAVLRASPHNWKMLKITRNGHCLFGSLVLALQKLNRPDLPKTVQDLRSACANQLRRWKGVIPGMEATLFDEGMTKVQVVRGEAEVEVSLEKYCQMLEKSMYGGFDEMMIVVQMFKVQIHLFHDGSYSGGIPVPVQIFLVNPQLPETDEVNAGPRIHLLLETARSAGISDHTTLMIHRHAEHAELMSRMPVIDVDYCVAQSPFGWGLKSMRDFDEEDCTGNCFTSAIVQCLIFIPLHAACTLAAVCCPLLPAGIFLSSCKQVFMMVIASTKRAKW
jgi:hypothetical protein